MFNLLINNFKALKINIIDELEENVYFSYTLSLREELFDVIYPEEVAELPMRHIIMQGTDERVAINGRKYKLGRIDETYTKDQYYVRSEEHTSELQSRGHLVCRLLLEKKKEKSMNKMTKMIHKRL